MGIEVTVGPPLITINRGDHLVLSEPDSCITAYTDQGIYSRDTRYVSNYEIFADGERWILQNSGALAYYASRAYLTNPKITTEYNEIEPATLTLILDRAVSEGIHEDYSNGRIVFLVDLEPRGDWHTCCHHEFVGEEKASRTHHLCVHMLRHAKSHIERGLSEWKKVTTSVTSSNEDVYRMFRQSVEDMAALRLPQTGKEKNEFIPAAGVPWFVTVFGRDSLIVSLQNLMVYPDFARGALNVLGKLQATEMDDYRDAQPGKILHEIRSGELAERKLIPHTPYYGTADATALYLITLCKAWKWLGDDSLFLQHQNVAEKCLDWIDRYGDMDGDGLQEYQTRSPQGYENMGWKDAVDSVVYPDGTPVRGPKALCELQGYTYDAWLRMADAFQYFGRLEAADRLRQRAADLEQKFEQLFWCEGTGFYAYALDGDKKQVKTIA